LKNREAAAATALEKLFKFSSFRLFFFCKKGKHLPSSLFFLLLLQPQFNRTFFFSAKYGKSGIRRFIVLVVRATTINSTVSRPNANECVFLVARFAHSLVASFSRQKEREVKFCVASWDLLYLKLPETVAIATADRKRIGKEEKKNNQTSARDTHREQGYHRSRRRVRRCNS